MCLPGTRRAEFFSSKGGMRVRQVCPPALTCFEGLASVYCWAIIYYRYILNLQLSGRETPVCRGGSADASTRRTDKSAEGSRRRLLTDPRDRSYRVLCGKRQAGGLFLPLRHGIQTNCLPGPRNWHA